MPGRTTRTLIRAFIATIVMMPATLAHAQPISWWYQRGANPEQQRALQRDLLDPFNEAHPDTPVKIEFRGATADRQIRMALLSGHGPDIVMTPGPTYLAPLARAGQLLPMDDLIKQYGWDKRLVGPVLQTGGFDGHIYGLPRTYETMTLFYNKTLFDKNAWQPPKTLAELQTLAAAMMQKGITPFGAGNADWRGANEWYVTLVLNDDAGPDNVYKALTGKLRWDDPVFVHSIELLRDWYQKGWFGKNYFSLTNEQGFARIADGSAGMSPNGFWAFQWVDGHFNQTGQTPAITPFPTLRDGVPYPVFPIGVGSTMSINKHSANVAVVGKFLNAMYSQDFYLRINKDWRGDWNLPLTDVDPQKIASSTSTLFASAVSALREATASGHYGYTTWVFWPPATEQYLTQGIEQVWLGQVSPKDYLTKANDMFQAELKEGKVPPIPPR